MSTANTESDNDTKLNTQKKDPRRRSTRRRSHSSSDTESMKKQTEEELSSDEAQTKENQLPSKETSLPTVFEEETDDAVFKTPSSFSASLRNKRHRRFTSAEVISRTPKLLQNSLILRTLSPEDSVEILKRSPMVEMSRRVTPVQKKAKVEADVCSKDDEVTQQLLGKFNDEDEVQKQEKEPAVEKEETDQQIAAKPTDLPPEAVDPLQPQAINDVSHFRNLLKTETERLIGLKEHWNKINDDSNLCDDISGQIRTTVGQAQLLMDQRFKQFTGLVDNCEFGWGEKETTLTDLGGFWDMIYFQVEDVDAKFKDLEKLQANDWKKPEVKKVVKKKTGPVKKKAPAGKSKFSEFRAKMKAQMKEKGEEEEKIKEDEKKEESVTDEKTEDETKTFDAGFFKVHSPIHSPKSQPSSKESTPLTAVKRVKSKHNTPVGGSPFLRAVFNNSIKRSLSKHSSEGALFTDPQQQTPVKRALSEVMETSDEVKRSPRRSTRSSMQQSRDLSAFLVPTDQKENELLSAPVSNNDSIAFDNSPVFPISPKTYSQKRKSSVWSQGSSSKKQKTESDVVFDLVALSPVSGNASNETPRRSTRRSTRVSLL